MSRNAINVVRESYKDIDDMDKAAAYFLDHVAWDRLGPVPIVTIAQSIGFKLFMHELENNVSGFLLISPDIREYFETDRIIVVNQNDSAEQRKFTVAHEIAHFLYDFDEDKEIVFFSSFDKDNRTDQKEERANTFARDLLMPKDAFCKAARTLSEEGLKYYEIVSKLCDMFGISSNAIAARYRELGLAESN
ncbi:MAG: ImmA/IrrE family metallo-endopeptidase [Firmicutes bacterium]|nr:ImmA/IrrE family metallo-endopeptidase [Bacillota bacterium]